MARRKKREARATVAPPPRLVLDAGAVIGWSRADPAVRALLVTAIELGADLRVPVAVLAEVLRGRATDAPVHRVLKAVSVFPTEGRVGRMAGALLGRTGGTNLVDALVAAEAVVLEADVLTGDPDDLGRLLADHPGVSVMRV